MHVEIVVLLGDKIIDGQYVIDCRLFLFLQKYTGGVKKGTEINRGEVGDTFEVGEIFINGGYL